MNNERVPLLKQMTEHQSLIAINDHRILNKGECCPPERSSISNEYTIPMQYSFMFIAKPFGIAFKNKDLVGAKTKTGVFVEEVDEKCAAYGHILIGSKLIKIQNDLVEGLPAVDIMKLFETKYDKVLPLLMTFQKPLNRRLSLTKQTAMNIKVSIDCNPRALFLDINAFRDSWRTLPSDILLDTLLICTASDYQRILKPNKANNIRNDAVFINLLQWKEKQGFIFIVNRCKKKKISTFWRSFSDRLVALSDPSTYNTAKYNALRLNVAWYKALDSFKYEVSIKDIENEFANATLNVNVIKEVLYRSRVLLHIYNEKGVIMNENVDQASPSFSLEEEFDGLLDEIATLWDEKHDDTFIE